MDSVPYDESSELENDENQRPPFHGNRYFMMLAENACIEGGFTLRTMPGIFPIKPISRWTKDETRDWLCALFRKATTVRIRCARANIDGRLLMGSDISELVYTLNLRVGHKILLHHALTTMKAYDSYVADGCRTCMARLH
ncbi:unnamed protein product [Caenorhabditis bovis]|uniref:SAM domain-containing protein n=1 Tax=Caenorhabditis bovis TaxID=2654633 RepID=A0A8S1ELY6_9PELO|nr:unnamed protein product [Caenorhabditis bovis]